MRRKKRIGFGKERVAGAGQKGDGGEGVKNGVGGVSRSASAKFHFALISVDGQEGIGHEIASARAFPSPCKAR